MNAFAGLLAVLVLWSSSALGQTGASQPAAASAAETASTPSTEAPAASAGAVPAAAFAPGAKLFLTPMDGFEQLLTEAILKKKVPVVLVNDRAKADFVVYGDAHVKKRGWVTGMVLSTRGKGNLSIDDAHTGRMVFAHHFKRADANLTPGQVYEGWADSCAKDLKKTLEKK